MAVDALNLIRRRQCKRDGVLKLAHGTQIVVELSTEDAKLLLEAIDERQRGLRGRVVARYLRDMSGKRHRPITPICVGNAGTVFDGQHRLHAHAQMPGGHKIKYIVLIPTEAEEGHIRSVVDIGAGRSAPDIAKLAGLDVPPVLVRAYLTEMGNGTASTIITRAEVPDCLMADKTSVAVAPFCARYKKTKVPQMAAFLRCARKDRTSAEHFFGAVFSEQPTVADKNGDRRYNVTVNTLIRYLANVQGMHRQERKEVFAKCIFAWNSWRRGEDLDRMPTKSFATPPEAI